MPIKEPDSKRLVTFKFKTVADKRKFLFGLLDGFGKTYCRINWNDREGVQIEDTKIIYVTVTADNDNLDDLDSQYPDIETDDNEPD